MMVLDITSVTSLVRGRSEWFWGKLGDFLSWDLREFERSQVNLGFIGWDYKDLKRFKGLQEEYMGRGPRTILWISSGSGGLDFGILRCFGGTHLRLLRLLGKWIQTL